MTFRGSEAADSNGGSSDTAEKLNEATAKAMAALDSESESEEAPAAVQSEEAPAAAEKELAGAMAALDTA